MNNFELRRIKQLYEAKLISEQEVILLLVLVDQSKIEENFDSYLASEVERRQAA